MEKFFKDVKILGKKALAYEVLLTPSPGLVDRNNSGAHKDMDIYTFIDSIFSWDDYLYKSCKSGYEFDGDEYYKLLEEIRPFGIEAEIEMAKVTKGVNTHKGAIFIFGILAAAIGSLKGEGKNFSIKSITRRGGEISSKILEDFNKDFDKEKLTYGETQFLKYGSYGIRGEAKNGFPSIILAYEVLLENLNEGYDLETALGESLLKLMEIVFDSNVVGRRGLEGLEILRYGEREILKAGGYKTKEGIEKIKEIDQYFINENISPGGCADLCGATLFLYWVEKYLNL